jgi:membrane fusion protein (multidrug efflux system)
MAPADFETAEATVISLEADLEGTLLKLDFTQVTAPTDGVVAKIGVHAGQFIQPGQTLMMIVDRSENWITANFKETQLGKVKTGLPVEVQIDAYPGVLWRGTLESIYPASGATMSLFPPENSTGNFTKIVQRIPVIIKLEQKANFELRPGMSAVSTIVLSK